MEEMIEIVQDLTPEIGVILVYTKEDEEIQHIVSVLGSIMDITGVNGLPFSLKDYNAKSSLFLEKRTANSLLSQHGTSATPLILFSKNGTVVRALYKEEKYESFEDAFVEKYFDAKEVDVTGLTPELDEEHNFVIDASLKCK